MTIKKLPDGEYRLVSKKSGKNLGTYSSRAGAVKREQDVEYFKHQHEEIEPENEELEDPVPSMFKGDSPTIGEGRLTFKGFLEFKK